MAERRTCFVLSSINISAQGPLVKRFFPENQGFFSPPAALVVVPPRRPPPPRTAFSRAVREAGPYRGGGKPSPNDRGRWPSGARSDEVETILRKGIYHLFSQLRRQAPALPHLPFACRHENLPAKRRGCGNSAPPSSAPGSGGAQFPGGPKKPSPNDRGRWPSEARSDEVETILRKGIYHLISQLRRQAPALPHLPFAHLGIKPRRRKAARLRKFRPAFLRPRRRGASPRRPARRIAVTGAFSPNQHNKGEILKRG